MKLQTLFVYVAVAESYRGNVTTKYNQTEISRETWKPSFITSFIRIDYITHALKSSLLELTLHKS